MLLLIMYRRPSRKKEIARRTLIYLLMTLTTLVLVGVLMMAVMGYRFNFETRSVEQTGLIQYNSYPRGATISVDGRNYERTQSKGTVLPGQRQFAMHLKGYETWQKTLDVEPGTVTWLNYVRLVPVEKEIESVEVMEGVLSVLASPDRRFMAGIKMDAEGMPVLLMMDFRNSRQPSVSEYPIDTTTITGFGEGAAEQNHRFSVVQWSESSRAVIIKHQYTRDEVNQTEWLWVDRESPANIVNLSSFLSLPITRVQSINSREVYLLQSNGDLRRATVSNGTISRPLLSKVTWFDAYDEDTLAYIGWREDERVAGVWQTDWSEPTVLASTPESSSQQLNVRVSEYFNKDTAVVSVGQSVTIYRGSLPATDEALAVFLQTARPFTFNKPVTNLQISQNGRFVVAEDDGGFISYDLERHQSSQAVKRHDGAPLRWIDTYHPWDIDESGHLVMQEFDGVNAYRLMPVASGYDVLLTQDDRYIYSFVADEDSVVRLQRLSMTI